MRAWRRPFMSMPIVFMYSGQGAQYYRMGEALYQGNEVFRNSMDRCDQIVAPLLGQSLVNVIFSGNKMDPFERTLFTHPANVMIGICLTDLLRHMGIEPQMVLGYSLGEVTAAVTAGALTMEDALEAVTRQGRMAEEQTPPGGMLAVLAEPEMMDREPQLFTGTWLACVNFDKHFVVSGPRDALAGVERDLGARDITCMMLPISHGFHSPLIDNLERETVGLFSKFRPPSLPLISSCLAGNLETREPEHFWKVIRRPVDFRATLHNLERQGPFHYLDVGPAGTMTTFVKYGISPNSTSRCTATLSPFGKGRPDLEPVRRALLES